MTNHYDWLDEHLPAFLDRVGQDFNRCPGIVGAHGDKFYTYKRKWEEAGIPFAHGVAIALLTYLLPDVDQSDVDRWVIDHYEEYKPFLDEANDE